MGIIEESWLKSLSPCIYIPHLLYIKISSNPSSTIENKRGLMIQPYLIPTFVYIAELS